ncbi:MAG: DUF3006 domain-containing protein [Clostridia bacterium]|nr:DUF3006 domain-containing protein [Clostridia bacterium]
MKIIIDRIEGACAVAELPDGTMAEVDIRILPDCAEGDVFTIEKDEEEMSRAKDKAKKALQDLFG